MKYFLSFSIFLFILSSCDEVKPPYIEAGGECGNGNLSIPIRKIFVEDYTGHKCGNCPLAKELLDSLTKIYCDHIVPVAVHVGYFAEPNKTGKYSTDLRTETGNELNEFFGNDNAGLPNGLINRTEYNASKVQTLSNWRSVIAKLLQNPPEIDMDIENSFSTETKNLTSKIKINGLKNIEKTLFLCVFLTEDSLVAWQKDYRLENPDIENYVHRHVLRISLNGTWGEKISEKLSQNQIVEKSFQTTLKNEWNAKHCEIVAFVYDSKTKEILQAEKKSIFHISKK